MTIRPRPDMQEVPHSRWSQFLSALSHRARTREIEVRVDSPALGERVAVTRLPLVGISCEEKGSAADAIEITLGRAEPLLGITHMVLHPVRVFYEPTADGEVAVLDIEDAAHVKTLNTFMPLASEESRV